jgi:hypothetical protein
MATSQLWRPILFAAILCLPIQPQEKDRDVRVIRGEVTGQRCDGSDAPCSVRIQTGKQSVDVIYSMSLPIAGCYFGEEARKAAALKKGDKVEIHVPVLANRSDLLLCGDKARVLLLP